MSTKLTTHFTLEACEASDFAASHDIDNTIPAVFYPNGTRLCTFMEEVRSFLSGHYGQDVPIYPSSIYRCPQLNGDIGGQPTSQHMRFEAMDWHVTIDTIDNIFDLLKASDLEFDQLILEVDKEGHRWIHTSVPDSGEDPRREVLEGEKGTNLNRVALG